MQGTLPVVYDPRGLLIALGRTINTPRNKKNTLQRYILIPGTR